jgi:hypothetical protein
MGQNLTVSWAAAKEKGMFGINFYVTPNLGRGGILAGAVLSVLTWPWSFDWL